MISEHKTSANRLAEQILQGDDRALSRGLSHVEFGGDLAEGLLACLYPHTGKAHVVGITGSPGSGKSTLTRSLARAARGIGLTVGIIAVDPSSPFSGGAILGDRIRMNDVAVELGVFIRSLATHGALGGLSRAAADSIDLMDAAGRQLIFVETVGVGQDEIDVMQTVHTVVVVSVPGLGDEIQTLKAGILEISDIHVVNKADREGADKVMAELRSMLTLDAAKNKGSWQPPVLECVALREEGVLPVLSAVRDHLTHLQRSGELDQRCRRIAKARLFTIARNFLSEATALQKCNYNDLLEGIVTRELAPYVGGRALLTRLAHCQAGGVRDV
jgi:LAO/AO transport system kinase